jgi:hypothetical protein
MDPQFRDSSINLALVNFVGSFSPSNKYYTMYFDEFLTTSQAHPECKVFQSEWSGNWYAPLIDHPTKGDEKFAGVATGAIVSSYQDFACWCAAQWVKRGIGCYFDNAFPLRATDTLTTSAYALPNGLVQPSAGIWARRDYLRRIWVIHHTMAPPDAIPVMMIHMTNTMILPYMVWDDQNLDLEWKYGPEAQQSKYPPDLLLAESTGRQTGSIPFVLARVSDATTPAATLAAQRTRFGTMMVHEIKWWGHEGFQRQLDLLTDFGYGQDDCKVYDYWEDGYPVTPSNPEAKSLLLQRNGALMLLVCTWNSNPETVDFKLDTARLGMQPAAATDAEDGAKLDFDGKTLKLPLDGYGVRIVKLQ